MAIGVAAVHPRHPPRPPLARSAPQGAAAARHRADRPRRRGRGQGRHQRRRVDATCGHRRAPRLRRHARRRGVRAAVHRLLGRFVAAARRRLPTPTPTATVIVPGGTAGARRHRGAGRAHPRPHRRDRRRRPTRPATRRWPRRGSTARRWPSAQTNYTLRAAIPDYARARRRSRRSRSRSCSRRRTTAGRARSWRSSDDDDRQGLEHHDADAAGRLVAVQALVHRAISRPPPQMPDLAPEYVGASQVPPDSSFLVIAARRTRRGVRRHPQQGRGERVLRHCSTPTADKFRVSVAEDRQRRLDEFNQTGASDGSLTFESAAGRPASDGPGHPRQRRDRRRQPERDRHGQADERGCGHQARRTTRRSRLSPGRSSPPPASRRPSAISCSSTSPVQGSNEKIRLLGYSSNILDAKVIQ